MHICIIDMQYSNNNISDFKTIFNKINPNITLSVMKYNDKNLIEKIKALQPEGIIISGSKYRILQTTAVHLPKELLYLGIPVLGICYGLQWQSKMLGGSISTFDNGFHKYQKIVRVRDPFYIPPKLYFFAHNDYVSAPPRNWVVSCKSRGQVWIAYEPYTKHMGIQFHSEKHIASGVAFFGAWLQWILLK